MIWRPLLPGFGGHFITGFVADFGAADFDAADFDAADFDAAGVDVAGVGAADFAVADDNFLAAFALNGDVGSCLHDNRLFVTSAMILDGGRRSNTNNLGYRRGTPQREG